MWGNSRSSPLGEGGWAVNKHRDLYWVTKSSRRSSCFIALKLSMGDCYISFLLVFPPFTNSCNTCHHEHHNTPMEDFHVLLPRILSGGAIKPFMAKTSHPGSLTIASLCHLDFHDLSMFGNPESLVLYSDLQLGCLDVSSGLDPRLRFYSLLFFCGTRKWGHGLTHGCGTEKHPQVPQLGI